MSYETTFHANYTLDNGLSIEDEFLTESIKSALKNNYSLMHQGTTESEEVNDWHKFIIDGNHKYWSIHYQNVNIHLQVAVQIIKDNLANSIDLELEWNGEESGDYTKNVYHIRKDNGQIKVTFDEEVRTTREVEVDLSEELERNYQ